MFFINLPSGQAMIGINVTFMFQSCFQYSSKVQVLIHFFHFSLICILLEWGLQESGSLFTGKFFFSC